MLLYHFFIFCTIFVLISICLQRTCGSTDATGDIFYFENTYSEVVSSFCRDAELFTDWLLAKFEMQRAHCGCG